MNKILFRSTHFLSVERSGKNKILQKMLNINFLKNFLCIV